MTEVHATWHAEPNNVLVLEIDGLRLVVRAAETSHGSVRFLVLRLSGDGQAILGSGNEENVHAAKGAAVRMAQRFLAHPIIESG